MGDYSPLIALLVPALTVIVVVLVCANRRPTSARKLGRPYSVNAKVAGSSGTATVTIRDGVISLVFDLPVGYPATMNVGWVDIPLETLRAVRVRDVGIALEYGDPAYPDTLVVITREQGAKERLLWELAVVAPEAVEAGISADSPRANPVATTLPPTGHAAQTSDTPDGARAVLDLDARMASLGSALAGPVDRPPPPPPRSGLGTGLFAAPPREGDA